MLSCLTFIAFFLKQGKQLFTTVLEDCVALPVDTDVSSLRPCTQEEADSRMLLHAAAATHDGHKHVTIRSSDSDVVVLAVAAFEMLKPDMEELWIAFGARLHFR